MGVLSWFFPSEQDRVDKARRYLEQERWADALDKVHGIESSAAIAVVRDAREGLARANLEAAVSWARAGDEQRVHTHMELADEYHDGQLAAEFREARKHLRGIRAQASEAEKRAREEREARLLSVDPLGFTGGDNLVDPPLPDGIDAEDADELSARLAILVDGYPESLRGAVANLGGTFAQAVLDLEDGRPDLALESLLQLPDDQPLVLYERARCAHALGDPRAGARALRSFAEHANGHVKIGRQHTAVLLAQMLAEARDLPSALRVLRDARATEPDVGTVLFAQLLEATNELAEAETVLLPLIKQHPRAQDLYKLLARIRLKGNHRVEAMRALETAMNVTCDTPGRCGYQPPDPEVVRTLATLYLEEGTDLQRGLELADKAAGLVQQPVWDDLYLGALAAQARKDPTAPDLAARLREHTPDEDPRQNRLTRYLVPA